MKEVAKYFTDTHLTLIGMMIFFIWFLVMIFFVFKLIPKKQHQLMALMPLRNDEGSHE